MESPTDPCRWSPELRVIGVIRSPFTSVVGTPIQPAYANEAAGEVIVSEPYAEALADIENFERVWLIYWMDRVRAFQARVVPYRDTREHGLFATRSPSRPNPIGISVVRLLGREGRVLRVAGLDVLDGTPLLDIKPYVPEFDAHPGARAGWFDETTHDTRVADDRFQRELDPEGTTMDGPPALSGSAGARPGGARRALRPEHELALQEVVNAMQAPASPAEKLADACRILQSLPRHTGVYVYALEGDTLVLRAFQGRVTQHIRIPSGEGICGASVRTHAPVMVADVGSDPRYLACNLETKSELVFPILRGETYLAQIDVDSDDKAAFGAVDQEFLSEVARLLEPLF